jgi:hypothetical protein
MDDKVSVVTVSEDSWDYLLTFLPPMWKEKCKELGAMKRVREFSGPDTLLRTLLIHLIDGSSLRETSVRARESAIADVSDVALLKRLNCSGEWFRWMAQEVMSAWIVKSGLDSTKSTRPIRAVDATCVNEPGNTGTDWRIHYAFDLRTLECTEMRVTDYSQGETLKNFSVEKDALYIGDRGYYNLEGIGHIVKGNGHVLIRMNVHSGALYNPKGKPFNMLKRLRSLTGAGIGDWPVYFQASTGKVTGRICAIRKSKIATQKTLERIHRDSVRKQTTPSKAAIEAARYVFVFTTLPEELLSATTALEFYRGRWQIELVFKRLKSLLGVGHLPKHHPGGAKAWIHGKLFCAMLIDVMTRAAERFSPWGYPLITEVAP